jgi:hypothetical protein
MRRLLILAICIAALAGNAAARGSGANDVKLEVYSNWPNSRTYLGCLNCRSSDPTSIWNPASRYGWSNPTGVWSGRAFRHANYRRLVCDMPPSTPQPAVLDEHYTFYYVLSIDAVRRESICAMTKSRQGCAVIRALCAGTPMTAISTGGLADARP